MLMQILWTILSLIIFLQRVNVRIQHMYGVLEIPINDLEYGYGAVKLFQTAIN